MSDFMLTVHVDVTSEVQAEVGDYIPSHARAISARIEITDRSARMVVLYRGFRPDGTPHKKTMRTDFSLGHVSEESQIPLERLIDDDSLRTLVAEAFPGDLSRARHGSRA